MIHFYTTGQIKFPYSNFIVNFTKYFSDARVYEIVDNCLSVVQNICSTEKLMMLGVVGNVFKIMRYSKNVVLFAGFKTIILCLFTGYDSWNTCFLLKYGSWKLQLDSWNTNHESLNRTLISFFLFHHPPPPAPTPLLFWILYTSWTILFPWAPGECWVICQCMVG